MLSGSGVPSGFFFPARGFSIQALSAPLEVPFSLERNLEFNNSPISINVVFFLVLDSF